jgi:hypothetical protein
LTVVAFGFCQDDSPSPTRGTSRAVVRDVHEFEPAVLAGLSFRWWSKWAEWLDYGKLQALEEDSVGV